MSREIRLACFYCDTDRVRRRRRQFHQTGPRSRNSNRTPLRWKRCRWTIRRDRRWNGTRIWASAPSAAKSTAELPLGPSDSVTAFKVRARGAGAAALPCGQRLHLDLPWAARRTGRRQARFSRFMAAHAGCSLFLRRRVMKREDAKQLADRALDRPSTSTPGWTQRRLLQRFLDCMSRFHDYSWHNCMLIAFQMPEASLVAGFRRWLELGRHVRKGEKGIGILAPLAYRKKEEADDPDNESEHVIRGFKVVHVFDVSQTEGEDLPQLAGIHGEPGQSLAGLEGLVRRSGITLKDEVLPLGTKGLSLKARSPLPRGCPPPSVSRCWPTSWPMNGCTTRSTVMQTCPRRSARRKPRR